MQILVHGSTGAGPTSLAAFDAALVAAGLANLNLIRLSSVIPPGSSVSAARSGTRPIEDVGRAAWGDRLYAVWAFQAAELLGQEAWAGVAWAQDATSGRGVFVEHEGGSEAQVRRELDASLSTLCRSRGMADAGTGSVVVGARCEGEPVAALVIAPYRTAGWDDGPGSVPALRTAAIDLRAAPPVAVRAGAAPGVGDGVGRSLP